MNTLKYLHPLKLVFALLVALIPFGMFAFEQESEHPSLPENTKKAIAKYKRDSSERNKAELLKIMNENYDAIIQKKKDKLADRVKNRDRNIKRWFDSIAQGSMPPFMNLPTENYKGDERAAVKKAIDAYRTNASAANKNAVISSLNLYYDAFLKEQEKHIKDTEDSREARMKTALERFTSDRFKARAGHSQSSVKPDEVLSEIVVFYISTGAEIVPVNPEARVRERSFNSAINNAQKEYLKNPTAVNKAALKKEIQNAYQAAYDVRVSEISKAKAKGERGVRELFEQLKGDEFLKNQYAEITQQRNLYGRIDRVVTFGKNTVGDWTPRMKEESKEFSKLLQEYKKSPSKQNAAALRTKLDEIYNQALNMQENHLRASKGKLDTYTETTLKELAE